jgi:hypothetical protein
MVHPDLNGGEFERDQQQAGDQSLGKIVAAYGAWRRLLAVMVCHLFSWCGNAIKRGLLGLTD